MAEKTNIISPAGFAALRAEYDALLGGERPKLVETISWAAGNGDRRVHLLQLTPRGRRRMQQRENLRIDRASEVLRRLPSRSRRDLLSALSALDRACAEPCRADAIPDRAAGCANANRRKETKGSP